MTRGVRLAFTVAVFVAAAAVLSYVGQRFADEPLDGEATIPSQMSTIREEERIVVLGSSLSVATPWDIVAVRLSDCLEKPVLATGIAGGGKTSAWGIEQLENAIERAPSILLVEFTINDADFRRGVSPAESLSAHRTIFIRMREAVPDARIAFLRLNKAYGIRALLRPALALYERNVARLVRDLGGEVIDLRSDWNRAALQRGRRDVLLDGLHPTPEAAVTVTVPAITAAVMHWIDPGGSTKRPECRPIN